MAEKTVKAVKKEVKEKSKKSKSKSDKLFGTIEEKTFKYLRFTGIVDKVNANSFFLKHKKKKSKHYLKRIIPFSKLYSFEGVIKVGETISVVLKPSHESECEKGELTFVRDGFISIITKKGITYSVNEELCDFVSEPC